MQSIYEKISGYKYETVEEHGYFHIRESNSIIEESADNLDILRNNLEEIIKINTENLPNDVMINLYTYLLYFNGNYTLNNFDEDELEYIVNASDDVLIDILSNGSVKYDGPNDPASLLFAILTGKSTTYPNIENVETRYKMVKEYPFNIVVKLLNTYASGIHMSQPHYVRLALMEQKKIEPIVTSVNKENVDELIEKYGLVLPASYYIYDDGEQRTKFFIDEVTDYYERILNRPANMMPIRFSPAEDNPDEKYFLLQMFTSVELIELYGPILDKSIQYQRRLLLNHILKDNLVPKWSFDRTSECKNKDKISIITGEPREILEANDKLISYGVRSYYRCYQLSELKESFRDYDGDFVFLDPDYDPSNDTIDFLTGDVYDREFTPRQIFDLFNYLEEFPEHREFAEFIKYNYQLMISQTPGTILKALKLEFLSFDNNEQKQVRTFLAWMFLYGMYMRFWKGPGHDYPLIKINVEEQDCSPPIRNENVSFQIIVHNYILSTFEDSVRMWINKLLQIEYNFNRQVFQPTKRRLRYLFDRVSRGTACIGYAADIIMITAYYLMRSMYISEDFNEIMLDEIKHLLDIEKQILPELLKETKREFPEDLTKIQFLQDKINNLEKPFPGLPTFDRKLPIIPNIHLA